MRKPTKTADKRKPVAAVVHSILEEARIARTDGPSSGLYSRDAQLSGALTQAGTLLAKLDGAAPAKRSSLLQQIVSSLSAPPKPRRRSWFFAAASATTMPDAKRIEQVLQAALKDSKRLVLDQDLPDGPSAVNNEIDCVLPPGAVDPVCEPR
jgi:hypothetical protein